MIRSKIHPAKAWAIRVDGTDLDQLQRFWLKKGRDRIAGPA